MIATCCRRLTYSCHAAVQVLFDRNYEDAYTDPGSPAKRRTPQGTYVLAQLADETDSGRRRLLMQARAAVNFCGYRQHADGQADAPHVRATMRTSRNHWSLRLAEWSDWCAQGSGASPEGNKPFNDLLDADSGETQRIWQSKPPYYESTGTRGRRATASTLDHAPCLTRCFVQSNPTHELPPRTGVQAACSATSSQDPSSWTACGC